MHAADERSHFPRIYKQGLLPAVATPFTLLLRRVHVVAELVGGEPELGLKADGGGGLEGLE
jgi:hypothetical protein